MKIILIRHGESTGNRDHIWAGITDNELTNHGFLQASRLATYLEKLYRRQIHDGLIVGIYCSDLIRAKRTATEVANALGKVPIVTELLREQDLGWREGRKLKDGDKTSPNNALAIKENPGESKAAMDERAREFTIRHIDKLLDDAAFLQSDNDERILVVVSHGLFLLRLFYQLTMHLKIANPPPVSWSNTGCTTLRVSADGTSTVTDVNSVQHLQGLKRTRAGVGSSQYDTKQQKMSDFFGSPKSRRQPDALEEEETKQKLEILEASEVVHDDAEAYLDAQIRAIDEACEKQQKGT